MNAFALNEISNSTKMITLNPRELSCSFKRKLKRKQSKTMQTKRSNATRTQMVQLRHLNRFRHVSVVQMNLSQCETYLQRFTALQDPSPLLLHWELFSRILFTTLEKGVLSYSRYVKSHSFCLLFIVLCSFTHIYLGKRIAVQFLNSNFTIIIRLGQT